MEEARDSLEKASHRMKKYADKKKRPLEFNDGDKVMLKLTPHIWKKISTKTVQRALIPRYDGPFEVLKKVGVVACRGKIALKRRLHGNVKLRYGNSRLRLKSSNWWGALGAKRRVDWATIRSIGVTRRLGKLRQFEAMRRMGYGTRRRSDVTLSRDVVRRSDALLGRWHGASEADIGAMQRKALRCFARMSTNVRSGIWCEGVFERMGALDRGVNWYETAVSEPLRGLWDGH
uniref:Tf2-1-like SH3-like domain-containing protein n=1 Tax=Chenopodium quinoa TaxID=63459 RepID=A0A803MKE4_CHEQI